MAKIILDNKEERSKLPYLLEGYFYGLGETCHTLFGAEGESAIYEAVGRYFTVYLKKKLGIAFDETDPWQRYCHIIDLFTSYGFYDHVEMEERADGKYWMLETGQYAGNIWEEQNAWERGTPPCPLWATILYSLSEINYTIVLDSVEFRKECRGYENTFHFDQVIGEKEDIITRTKKAIRTAITPICAQCKKIRDDDGNWVSADAYFIENFNAKFTHCICNDCAAMLYPELDFWKERDKGTLHHHDEKGLKKA